MAQILIISGNPDASSFDHALAMAYYNGVVAGGNKADILELGSLQFDPILHHGYKEVQQLEPDLLNAQQLIRSAHHLVFVYPNWWGSMPALLKGFIDRVFLPGFAFKHHDTDMLWERYLTGKTARIILTEDSPWWWNMLMYHRSAIFSVKAATLEYCGIKPVRITSLNKVRYSSEIKRQRWLLEIEQLGRQVK